MKKYTILFAIFIGMILLAVEAVPALQVSAQVPGGCGGKGQPVCPPGGPQIPGPKNRKPTPVPPSPVPAGPTLVMSLPTVPVVMPIIPSPTSYPYPYKVPDHNVCRVGPCGPLIINPGDPVEMLAGGGILAFLIVVGVAFFRGRSAQGGGGGAG